MADLAYKGFKEIKSKLLIAIKKPKNKELSKEAKGINKEISRRRITIEHINSKRLCCTNLSVKGFSAI